MSQDYGGVYLPTAAADTYESTPLANAGWYEEGQHGGAIAALLTGHVESIPTLTPMEISRVTVEIFRVIPLVPLRIETEVQREGKRIQSIQARVFDPADTLLSVATVLRLRTIERPTPKTSRPGTDFPGWDQIESRQTEIWGIGEPGVTMFHRHAVEIREAVGGFDERGPGTAWIRLAVPIVADREISPVQRVVAAADFCNGVSRALSLREWVFMNPDLTVHVTRYPIGEWVALSAESSYSDTGRGLAAGSLWDDSGFIGRSTQSLYVDRI